MYVGDETFTSNLTYVLGLILKAQTYLLILPDILSRDNNVKVLGEEKQIS